MVTEVGGGQTDLKFGWVFLAGVGREGRCSLGSTVESKFWPGDKYNSGSKPVLYCR